MNGLWTIEFGSSTNMFGSGVAVFQDGRVFGGDATYFYVGEYSLQGNSLSATIKSAPFIQGAESIFRTSGRELILKLVGSLTSETTAVVQGHPDGIPDLKFGAKLTKRA